MAILAIIAVIAVALVLFQATDGGSLLSGGGTLSAEQIAVYAAAAGWTGPDLDVAVAIALAESSGNPAAVGDQNLAPTNGPSIGLWQINIGAHPDAAGQNLTDPQTNANYAYGLYANNNSSFGQWSTYTNGAYSSYLVQAQAGVNAAGVAS
jgi:hypothetical protein